MKIKRIIVIAAEPALKREPAESWFEEMTKEQQSDYIEQHPNSKYAKKHNKSRVVEDDTEEKVEPTKIGNKKKQVKEVKEKRDPYADVPEEDRKKMIELKERGFVVPPAWRNLWINPDKDSYCVAKGRDSKNRLHGVYTVDYQNARKVIKFNRLKKKLFI